MRECGQYCQRRCIRSQGQPKYFRSLPECMPRGVDDGAIRQIPGHGQSPLERDTRVVQTPLLDPAVTTLRRRTTRSEYDKLPKPTKSTPRLEDVIENRVPAIREKHLLIIG